MEAVSNPGLFILAVMVLNITPGPDTMLIVGQSVTRGHRAGLLAAAGISLGCATHVLLAVLGLSALLLASEAAFNALKLAGAVYLVWLGVTMLRDKGAQPAQIAEAPRLTRRGLLLRAYLTNLLNPKVVLFMVSFFPQFIRPGAPGTTAGLLTLGAIFIALSTVYNSSMAWVSGRIAARLSGSGTWQRWVNRLTGIAFLGVGIRLLSVSRPGS
ncbi:LysE family translocator [Niveibacterium umoris]|uniref:RhtB (Resistance to homoserine/threonine) family protein n=1 Tax=Niveibacterium umoris TaxID=1193620 RepID=A0A840BQ56_9RHOO|nr:LysE family translocator [Niveibacterium umoris]MBB4012557.1 RhtB (resistance to homoserine/threonine) family protein [Niveibacterium umoris]